MTLTGRTPPNPNLELGRNQNFLSLEDGFRFELEDSSWYILLEDSGEIASNLTGRIPN